MEKGIENGESHCKWGKGLKWDKGLQMGKGIANR